MIIMLLGSMPTTHQVEIALTKYYPNSDIQPLRGFLFPEDCLLVKNKTNKAAIISLNPIRKRITIIGINGKNNQKLALFISMLWPNKTSKIPFEKEIVHLLEDQFDFASSIAL